MISFQLLARRYPFLKITDTFRIHCHSYWQSPQRVSGLCDASVYPKTLSRLIEKVHFSTSQQLLHTIHPQIQKHSKDSCCHISLQVKQRQSSDSSGLIPPKTEVPDLCDMPRLQGSLKWTHQVLSSTMKTMEKTTLHKQTFDKNTSTCFKRSKEIKKKQSNLSNKHHHCCFQTQKNLSRQTSQRTTLVLQQ